MVPAARGRGTFPTGSLLPKRNTKTPTALPWGCPLVSLPRPLLLSYLNFTMEHTFSRSLRSTCPSGPQVLSASLASLDQLPWHLGHGVIAPIPQSLSLTLKTPTLGPDSNSCERRGEEGSRKGHWIWRQRHGIRVQTVALMNSAASHDHSQHRRRPH